MDDHVIQDNEITLGCSMGADDIIELTIAGRITAEHMAQFAAWAEDVKAALRERAEKAPTRVLVMSDVSHVGHFEKKPISILRDLLDYDKTLTTKSAIVGANHLVRMLLDAVVSIVGRTNVRQFDTKDEARAWLLS